MLEFFLTYDFKNAPAQSIGKAAILWGVIIPFGVGAVWGIAVDGGFMGLNGLSNSVGRSTRRALPPLLEETAPNVQQSMTGLGYSTGSATARPVLPQGNTITPDQYGQYNRMLNGQ